MVLCDTVEVTHMVAVPLSVTVVVAVTGAAVLDSGGVAQSEGILDRFNGRDLKVAVLHSKCRANHGDQRENDQPPGLGQTVFDSVSLRHEKVKDRDKTGKEEAGTDYCLFGTHTDVAHANGDASRARCTRSATRHDYLFIL